MALPVWVTWLANIRGPQGPQGPAGPPIPPEQIEDAVAEQLPPLIDEEIDSRNLVDQPNLDGRVAGLPVELDLVQHEDVGYEWAHVQMYENNREVFIGQRHDGSYFPPGMNQSFADLAVMELTRGQGWQFVVMYEDREPAWGIRNDGSFFNADPVAAKATLLMVGDSLAAHQESRLTMAQTMLARGVQLEAVSGQRSDQHGARTGALPARVTTPGKMIPASGAVPVTLTTAAGVPISPLQTGNSVTVGDPLERPASLAGVAGVLRSIPVEPGVTNYEFERTGAGLPVPVPDGTPLIMGTQYRGVVPVFYGPRNDLGSHSGDLWRIPLSDILATYRAMIDWLAPDGRFIMLSVPPWADQDPTAKAALQELNDGLRDLAPGQWADYAAWLRTPAAFDAAGVAMTVDDEADIANEVTPRSLRNTDDRIHLNTAGYRAVYTYLNYVIASRGL